MNTEQIVEYWSAWMAAQNCTGRTIKERRLFIRSVVRFTGSDPLTVTKHQLVAFLGRPGLTGRTRQNYRSTLYGFFSWMQDEDMRLDNPAAKLPKPKAEPVEPNPISTEDLQKVLLSGIYGHTVMKVLLYSYAGLRASEIAAVAGEYIDWDNDRILTKEGKGRKEVWRPLHPIIRAYADRAHYPREGFWFPSPDGERHIRGKSVSNTLSQAFRRARINHTAHDMRAWFITTQLEAGVDSLDVQDGARHGDGQSLKHYRRPIEHRMRTAQSMLPVVQLPDTRFKVRQAA